MSAAAAVESAPAHDAPPPSPGGGRRVGGGMLDPKQPIYPYTSNTNSNGSSMAGFNGATDFHNLLTVFAMLAGRYLPMACVLALAGRLARQQPGVGTLRPQGINFVVLATGAALILALLNFLPALSLGTIADGLT
ncbi:potassium-transporting ATPase subunit KdpA [Streptomyces violascens]|uniref:potassium-transporting ATPase subunit KdpA n=1 Tax=Streptomyces violascens TaxID=67381 RepID=UPI00367E6078